MSNTELEKDIYFQDRYINLYCENNESIFSFNYTEGSKFFKSKSIKKQIKSNAEIESRDYYFDLETAYGYGGYITSTLDDEFLKNAFLAYKDYCISQNVIAEFIRFHPFGTSPEIYKKNMTYLEKLKKTVSICLKCNTEERWKNYSRSTRTKIRNSQKILRFEETDDIEMFKDLYRNTMDLNKADNFYYFSNNYFEKLRKLNEYRLFKVTFNGQVINACIILVSQNLAHYHLAGREIGYDYLNGSFFLMDQICEFLKKTCSSISYLHLGGGRSNSTDDHLLAFKTRFSDLTHNYYIGGNVFNENIYNTLIKNTLTTQPTISKFRFLSYREDSSE